MSFVHRAGFFLFGGNVSGNVSLFPELDAASFVGLKSRLDRLGDMPPQVLLLDGGSEEQRLAAARYWACRCNCPSAGETGTPCLACPCCQQIASQEHLDVLAFDGRISNTKDRDEPGPIRALNMENVRDLKRVIQDPPHGNGLRVVMLLGMDNHRSEAANALLKALEEPQPSTLFVLLTAQREQLLPTLVSRSHCILLPWPDPEAEAMTAERRQLAAEVADFLATGRTLFVRTQKKGFSLDEAVQIISLLEKSLLRIMAGRGQDSGIDQGLARLGQAERAVVSGWLTEARERMAGQVSPVRVMEALMMQLYVLVHRG